MARTKKTLFQQSTLEDLDALEDRPVESLRDFSKDTKAVKQLTNFSWLKL